MDPDDPTDAELLAAFRAVQERMLRAGWLEMTVERGDVFACVTTETGSSRLHFLRTALKELGYSAQDTGERFEALALMLALFQRASVDCPPRVGDEV